MGKGCKSECGSYSSIAVIDTLSEAYGVCLLERGYMPIVRPRMLEEQEGVFKERSWI
jgi:hypothetical protein